jgi:hypothetical protein
MSQENRNSYSELRAEVAALQRQLQALAASQAGAAVDAGTPSRRRWSKKVMMVLLPAMALLATSGLLYGQGEALFINAKGWVGIGTSEPQAPLDVKGSIKTDKLLIGNTDVMAELKFVHFMGNTIKLDKYKLFTCSIELEPLVAKIDLRTREIHLSGSFIWQQCGDYNGQWVTAYKLPEDLSPDRQICESQHYCIDGDGQIKIRPHCCPVNKRIDSIG